MDVDWEVPGPSSHAANGSAETPYYTPTGSSTPATNDDDLAQRHTAARPGPPHAQPSAYICLDTNILIDHLPTVTTLHARLVSSGSGTWLLVGQQVIHGACVLPWCSTASAAGRLVLGRVSAGGEAKTAQQASDWAHSRS